MSKKKPPLQPHHPVDAMVRFDRLLARMAPRKVPPNPDSPLPTLPKRGTKAKKAP